MILNKPDKKLNYWPYIICLNGIELSEKASSLEYEVIVSQNVAENDF